MSNDYRPEVQVVRKENPWVELIRFIVIALLFVIPFRIFIAQPFIVSGSSMVPTFQNGNYLIIDEISYILGTPKRGDVVVFKYPEDPKKYFIKRIIGLPGETVHIEGNVITIFNTEHPNGLILTEPFVKNQVPNNDYTKHTELHNDEYFVMGDNRPGSSDSRSWGPVKKNLLIGRAFLRVLPLNKTALFPGDYKQETN